MSTMNPSDNNPSPSGLPATARWRIPPGAKPNRTAGEARDSYLFIADQWERLAELAREADATGSFG